ncbi:circadian clock KaiB family protein [Calditrichota bacterium GD2]
MSVNKQREMPASVQKWIFELYIAGQSPRSLQAIANLKLICEKNLKENYELTVIDVTENPSLARVKQIIALPTLIRLSPSPERKVVGDLSELDRAAAILELVNGK